jgi:thiamine pyrophosphate-dependent acetolactate synthase large subunit-like protein
MSGPPVDFAAIARAHGARGYVIETAAQLQAALDELRGESGPAVLDLRIDPTARFAVNSRVRELSNFSARSSNES